MSCTMFACIILVAVGLAHAVLHMPVVVKKPATGAEMEKLPKTSENIQGEACTKLKSVEGTAYTVTVNVGRPEQKLDVIVDTGSNQLIVESCRCKDEGHCAPVNKCFGEEKSSTVSVIQGPKGPSTAVLKFGSGSIMTEVASDSVRIGSMVAKMDRGVLLMTDMALDFGGPFEGILGLGLPNSTDGPMALWKTSIKTWKKGRSHLPAGLGDKPTFGGGFVRQAVLGCWITTSCFMEPEPWRRASSQFAGKEPGISHFSLCFTDTAGQGQAPDGGVLRFNPPEAPRAIKSIGTMHWGLDLQGVSVGHSQKMLPFCSAEEMPSHQTTACGAIPDSGTTYIMGPGEQVDALFEAICDEWPRCKNNYTIMSAAAEAGQTADVVRESRLTNLGVKSLSKVEAFKQLLQDCTSWMDETHGVNELPPIRFHVGDDTGLTKDLKLTADVYTVSSMQRERRQATVDVPGVGNVAIGWVETGREILVCRPAFAEMDYPTSHNGPAWIIGMPLFHRYTVGFDLAAEPPGVSFTEDQCGSCGADGKTLLRDRARSPALRPLTVRGPPRFPRTDAMLPF